MEVRFALAPADLARYRMIMLRRAMKLGGIEAFDKQVAIAVALIVGATLLAGLAAGATAAGVTGAAGLLAGFVLQAVAQNLRQARATRVADADSIFVGEQTLTLSGEGVAVDGGRFRSFYAWGLVREAIEEDGLVVLLIAPTNGVIVPAAAFVDADAKRAFLARAREGMGRR
jgi:hypothetical protein